MHTVAPANRVATLRMQFGFGTVWVVTLCLVRLSIAAQLLRFGQDYLWRGILYGIATLQIIISTGYVIIQFIACQPLSGLWENVPGTKCWPVKPILILGWVVAGM